MSMNYAGLANTAHALLQSAGRSVTLRIFTAGTYDLSTGKETSTSSDQTRQGVLFDFAAGKTTERGNLIEGTDKRLILDAKNTAPSMKDEIVVGSDIYKIISIGEIDPAGTPVIYDLHLRK